MCAYWEIKERSRKVDVDNFYLNEENIKSYEYFKGDMNKIEEYFELIKSYYGKVDIFIKERYDLSFVKVCGLYMAKLIDTDLEVPVIGSLSWTNNEVQNYLHSISDLSVGKYDVKTDERDENGNLIYDFYFPLNDFNKIIEFIDIIDLKCHICTEKLKVTVNSEVSDKFGKLTKNIIENYDSFKRMKTIINENIKGMKFLLEYNKTLMIFDEKYIKDLLIKNLYDKLHLYYKNKRVMFSKDDNCYTFYYLYMIGSNSKTIKKVVKKKQKKPKYKFIQEEDLEKMTINELLTLLKYESMNAEIFDYL